MRLIAQRVFFVGVLALFGMFASQAADTPSKAEFDDLKREIERLKQQVNSLQPVTGGVSDDVLDNRYGPNEVARTSQGKLTMGGLLQVWYYTIQNDNKGWIDPNGSNGGPGARYASNEVVDNDSFRIRRAELKFQMDITENVTGVVMLDPAREATSFPSFGSNQSQADDGVAYFDDGFDPNNQARFGNAKNSSVQNGSGNANRLLQDAYINVHGMLPHHDVTTGQMRRRLGYEGNRDSSALDFVERSMITQLADLRDLGFLVHGFWWEDRFQYWVGWFDGAGSAFQQRQNRADDNDSSDYVASILLRPLWKNQTWGSIELGYSILYGTAGESAGHFPADRPVDGLNRDETVRVHQYAYLAYFAGEDAPVAGLWLKGEWGNYRDRFAPIEVHGVVRNPAPFNIQGWYGSIGYDLRNSVFTDDLKDGGLMKNLMSRMEVAFRYEQMENLFHEDLNHPTRRMDIFKTHIYTAGVNYYLKGNNAKIQMNYNWVDEEDKVDRVNSSGDARNNGRQVREVRNNNFVVNFQVAW